MPMDDNWQNYFNRPYTKEDNQLGKYYGIGCIKTWGWGGGGGAPVSVPFSMDA